LREWLGGRVARAFAGESMKVQTPVLWPALILGSLAALYLLYSHLDYLGDVSFLGAVVFLEIVIGCLWRYDQRFFPLLIIVFLLASMNIPLQSIATSARWVVLAAGAAVGFIVWIKNPRKPFTAFHLMALFCVGTAFVSATVSPFLQMAMFKALSLLLLFLYGCGGARLAVVGREDRFFAGLLWGCEIVVYLSTVFYFGLGLAIWGNPNSLGAAMSIGIFPILLWGWLRSDPGVVRWRRAGALLLCTCLIVFSLARAGMVAMLLVTLLFGFVLRQYKSLLKVAGLTVALIAAMGMVSPTALIQSFDDLKDAVLYKGHKEEGVLGSRKDPWEKSVAGIKEHPLFGTGYGTSPTGQDTSSNFGRFESNAGTSREHGSSYMAITEWVGLLGVLPFLVLIGFVALNAARVLVWMRKAANPNHWSVPLAMVLLAGFVHAGFEDWLFAVGSYPCVYFWTFAFMLADLVPTGDQVLVPRTLRDLRHPAAIGLEPIVPSR
jgi:O-antigen ligase